MKNFLFALLLVSSAAVAATPQTAVLAGGCFWGMEEFFRKQPGVVSTEVGYSGGRTENPTYEQSSSGTTGHAESVRIVFDPAKITYAKLLELFFKMHDPTTLDQQGNDVGTQYRSAIFTMNDEQKQEAERVKKLAAAAWKAPITTEIAPFKKFFRAEEYHQKYLVKHPGGYDNHYLRDLKF